MLREEIREAFREDVRKDIREELIEEIRTEGRVEAAREIAQQMLRMGDFSVDVVVRITGLNADEVQCLATEAQGELCECKDAVESHHEEIRDDTIDEVGEERLAESSAECGTEGCPDDHTEARAVGRRAGMSASLLEGLRNAARQMLHTGDFSVEAIARSTGLSVDEVRRLDAE